MNLSIVAKGFDESGPKIAHLESGAFLMKWFDHRDESFDFDLSVVVVVAVIVAIVVVAVTDVFWWISFHCKNSARSAKKLEVAENLLSS